MIYNKSGVSSYGSVLLSLIFDHHSLTFDLINLRFGILYSIMLNIPWSGFREAFKNIEFINYWLSW